MAYPSKSLLTLCAADIMSRQVVVVPREMSLQGAARMLARAGVTGAPVVDAAGGCIGVLSATDFMHWVEKDRNNGRAALPTKAMCSAWQVPELAGEPACQVEDFMTKDPVLVPARTRFGELARIMLDAHIHRVVVVEAGSQRPIGIVSSTDMLAAITRAEAEAAEGVLAEVAMASMAG